jgi:GT2 family glycosyltransferase
MKVSGDADLRPAVVIPSLGAACLGDCLEALAKQSVAARVVVVLSGGAVPLDGDEAEWLVCSDRLGFARAVNRGLDTVLDACDVVAVVNDDAIPDPRWLETLVEALAVDASVAAVQGTVLTGDGSRVDGRGLSFDSFGLPVQRDRDRPADSEPGIPEAIAGVSATAALYRATALRAVRFADGAVFDPAFDSYHEDVDLALRLLRLGHAARWCPDARCRHLGSATASGRVWRHPTWVLVNRWRALAGNLTPWTLFRLLPRLLRGELRAVRTLARTNSRSPLAAVGAWLRWPAVCAGALFRATPGPRLRGLP